MKKKLLSALLSVAMVSALLAGCGNKTEAPAAEAPAAEATEETAEEAPAAEEAPDEAKAESKPLAKMLKAELIEYAKEQGIEIDEKATKAVIIETIEAAK